MRHLKTSYHESTPENLVLTNKTTIITRLATRAIVLRKNGSSNEILMLYTKRYDDYTLPGGGIDKDEEIEAGFIRELQEETGAQAINNIQPFGLYEEYRPWMRNGFNIMKMLSYCFTCEIGPELGNTRFESYEVNNGMKPVWIDIDEAIAHNVNIIENSEKKGLSIERETFLLNLIKEEIINID